mmetsp:Transcript_49046/g.157781  ORF Transcript_49046/g.157781 Transcript_49046/m.157781 type:complete len:305 (-) Transcript_49046:330-1244(-)
MTVRILAIHGYGGTFGCALGCDALTGLKDGLGSRGLEVEFSAPRSPHATDDGTGVAWLAGDQRAAGKVVGFTLMDEVFTREGCVNTKTPQPLTAADLPALSEEDNIWEGLRGFESSLDLLVREWEGGAFDGLLGFSQGTLMASLLCAHLREARSDLRQPKFIILCAGFMRPWPAAAGAWWPPCPLLDVPSLHVVGERDTIVANCRSEELCGVYAKSVEFRHRLVGHPPGFGGHVVPWPGDPEGEAFLDALKAFLTESCKEAPAASAPLSRPLGVAASEPTAGLVDAVCRDHSFRTAAGARPSSH